MSHCTNPPVVEIRPAQCSDPYFGTHSCAEHIFEIGVSYKPGDQEPSHYEMRLLTEEEQKVYYCCWIGDDATAAPPAPAAAGGGGALAPTQAAGSRQPTQPGGWPARPQPVTRPGSRRPR